MWRMTGANYCLHQAIEEGIVGDILSYLLLLIIMQNRTYKAAWRKSHFLSNCEIVMALSCSPLKCLAHFRAKDAFLGTQEPWLTHGVLQVTSVPNWPIIQPQNAKRAHFTAKDDLLGTQEPQLTLDPWSSPSTHGVPNWPLLQPQTQ